jgi:hypothetical protein
LVGKLVVFVGLFLMGNIILGYVRVGFIAMCQGIGLRSCNLVIHRVSLGDLDNEPLFVLTLIHVCIAGHRDGGGEDVKTEIDEGEGGRRDGKLNQKDGREKYQNSEEADNNHSAGV